MARDDLLLFSAVITAVCLAASAVVVVLFLRMKRRRRAEAGEPEVREKLPRDLLRTWRLALILWPLCCLGLSVFFLRQWSRGAPGFDPVHAAFPILSLIFFFIGMGLRYGTVKRQALCTVPAPDATVVRLDSHRGNNGIVWTPVYRYTAEGVVQTVSSRSSYHPCPVRAGEAVELYYSPGNRRSIYVPREERTNRRWSALLCGVGILFPLAVLLAPTLTVWVESLPPWPPRLP